MGLFSGLLRNQAQKMRYEQMMGDFRQQYGDDPRLQHFQNMMQMGRPDLASQYFAEAMQPQAQQASGPQFQMVDNPFGRGGVGQIDRATGKIVNYQGPQQQPQRRILKGPDGIDRYTDTGEPVFPGVEAPPKQEPINITGEQAFRKEWSNESKIFRDTQDGFRRVMAASERDSASGDHALIFAYMKTQDPESVVRESEFDIAQSLGSMPQRVRAYAMKYLNGERLTPEQRRDLVETSRAIYQEVAVQQQRKRDQFLDIAKQYNFPASRVVVDYLDKDLLKTPEVSIGGLTVGGQSVNLQELSDEEFEALASQYE